jgi:hypothetical protein
MANEAADNASAGADNELTEPSPASYVAVDILASSVPRIDDRLLAWDSSNDANVPLHVTGASESDSEVNRGAHWTTCACGSASPQELRHLMCRVAACRRRTGHPSGPNKPSNCRGGSPGVQCCQWQLWRAGFPSKRRHDRLLLRHTICSFAPRGGLPHAQSYALLEFWFSQRRQPKSSRLRLMQTVSPS